MAWARTAMAFAAVGGAILKRNVPIGLAVLAKGAIARPRRLFLITVAIVAVSVAALVVAFLAPGPHHAG
jgi:uncharacterized membrane protein YidH (DUF202 family)